MKFKFKIQQYQTDAVDAVVRVFKGQPYQERTSFRRDIGELPASQQMSLLVGENGEIFVGDKDFVISPDGTISQNGEVVDRLLLSYIDPEGNIDKFGANMFTSVDAGEVPEGERFEIIQGAYERSNIDLNYEMTMMMNANRLYEASSSILKLMDSMNQKAATQICKLN